MTLMSCKRAEKLMPLYAAGDLPEGRRRRAVAAHVAACEACAGLAGEFRASREWMLAADAVPEFGEEFYEGLRAGVLDEINRDTRPAAPQRFAPFFAAPAAFRRLAYAASIALAACALALALFSARVGKVSQGNQTAVVMPPSERSIESGANKPAPPTTQPGVPTQGRDGRRQQPSTQATPRGGARPAGKIGGGGYKRTPTLRHAPPTRAAAPAPVLTAANDAAQQDAAPAAPRAETASVSRIEIQTADPNIRIIWLAPSRVEETEPDGVDPNR